MQRLLQFRLGHGLSPQNGADPAPALVEKIAQLVKPLIGGQQAFVV